MIAESQRPLLRGVSHLLTAFLALFGALALFLLADSAVELFASVVYSFSLVLLFAVSGTYHSLPGRTEVKRVLQKLDHSMIFVLIAGSYTPFCLLVLDTGWGIALLSLVWLLAVAGIVSKVAWIDAPRWVGVTFYLALGWLAVAASPVIAAHLNLIEVSVLAAGGAAYTVGAFIYGLKRPDPVPRVFGYHEVFHLLVIAGAALHYAIVVNVVAS